jgi:hypothetical protein
LPSSSGGFLECLDFPLFTIRSHLLFLVTNLVMVSSLILLSFIIGYVSVVVVPFFVVCFPALRISSFSPA